MIEITEKEMQDFENLGLQIDEMDDDVIEHHINQLYYVTGEFNRGFANVQLDMGYSIGEFPEDLSIFENDLNTAFLKKYGKSSFRNRRLEAIYMHEY